MIEVIAIGASTGGTEALRTLLSGLAPHFPPILIVQHMPEAFLPGFARQLAVASGLPVAIAREGEAPQRDQVYLAPGNAHLLLHRHVGQLTLHCAATPPINFHRPSVDALFFSVAEAVAERAIGVILTGMGNDGAAGLKAMRERGAWTIGQDRASSVVYGMPRVAAEIGALCEEAPLAAIAARIRARL